LARLIYELNFCKNRLRIRLTTAMFSLEICDAVLGISIAFSIDNSVDFCAFDGSVYVSQHLVTIQIQSAAANL